MRLLVNVQASGFTAQKKRNTHGGLSTLPSGTVVFINDPVSHQQVARSNSLTSMGRRNPQLFSHLMYAWGLH